MTIPENLDFSIFNEDFTEVNSDSILDYTRDFAQEVQTSYQNIALNFNGFHKASFLDNTGTLNRQENWTPILAGSTTAGTFTYVHQTGWAFRQGLVTDVWFDIQWSSSGSAAGNLYVELPYLVAEVDDKPFVGTIQSSSVTYATGTYMVCNAIPDTYRCEIWTAGSGVATANRTVVSSGQLIGNVRYIGVQDE